MNLFILKVVHIRLRAIIHYVFLARVFGVLHQFLGGFWVVCMFSCFFLPSVEQFFLEEQFPLKKILYFFVSRKNSKNQKPENLKTQKLIQKNT